jgi:hypothetical protein
MVSMNKPLCVLILLCALPAHAAQTGCVQGDCVDGTGTLYYTGGNRYEGQFKAGVVHGQGALTYIGNPITSGNRYEGQFKGGTFHGQGTYTFADGTKYVGDWKAGIRHGQGTLTMSDPHGSKYVGAFVDGKQHGQGTLTLSSGIKYVGAFADGAMHGQGTCRTISWMDLSGLSPKAWSRMIKPVSSVQVTVAMLLCWLLPGMTDISSVR